MSDWREEPSFEMVQIALKTQAKIKAQIEVLETELKIEQAFIAKKKPRDTAAKVVGIDEESQTRLIELQRDLAKLRGELAYIESNVTFNKFYMEMFKALAYRERF